MLDLRDTNLNKYNRVYFIHNENEIKEVILNDYAKAMAIRDDLNTDREYSRYYITSLSPVNYEDVNDFGNNISVITLNNVPLFVYINDSDSCFDKYNQLKREATEYQRYDLWGKYIF